MKAQLHNGKKGIWDIRDKMNRGQRGFDTGLADRQMDICDSRVNFVTENSTSGIDLLIVHKNLL